MTTYTVVQLYSSCHLQMAISETGYRCLLYIDYYHAYVCKFFYFLLMIWFCMVCLLINFRHFKWLYFSPLCSDLKKTASIPNVTWVLKFPSIFLLFCFQLAFFVPFDISDLSSAIRNIVHSVYACNVSSQNVCFQNAHTQTLYGSHERYQARDFIHAAKV